MANDKKPELKKPKFNQNWIFGAIIFIFLALMFSGGGSWSQPKKITQTEFETFLTEGDVDKIDIVNRKVAKVYLTSEAKAKDIHTKKKGNSILPVAAGDANWGSAAVGDREPAHPTVIIVDHSTVGLDGRFSGRLLC